MAEINTKQIVKEWKEELKLEVEKLKAKGVYPKLTIVQDSQTKEECARYKKGKYSNAKELGIECEDIIIETEEKDKTSILRDLMDAIKDIDNPVIVQMPFTGISISDLSTIIPYEYDVDGFTMEQKHLLDINDPKALVPCTAKGVMKLLEEVHEDLCGLVICIVNRSDLIGKPLFKLALHKDMTPIMCHSKTNHFDLNRYMSTSDIIITGCGRRAIFNTNQVSNVVRTIIDCSMYRGEDGKVGDFNKEDVLNCYPYINIASGYGHSGVTTVVALMENVIQVYKNILEFSLENEGVIN